MGSTNPTARTVDAIVATIPSARSVFVKLLTGRENVKVSIPSELSELDACPLNTQCPSTNVGEGGKSSRKLLRGPQLQLGVQAGSLLPFWAWRRLVPPLGKLLKYPSPST